MIVHVEEIRDMQKRRREINQEPLESIEWYENGVKLEIPKQVIERFGFAGMSNIDFINTRTYKEKGEA